MIFRFPKWEMLVAWRVSGYPPQKIDVFPQMFAFNKIETWSEITHIDVSSAVPFTLIWVTCSYSRSVPSKAENCIETISRVKHHHNSPIKKGAKIMKNQLCQACCPGSPLGNGPLVPHLNPNSSKQSRSFHHHIPMVISPQGNPTYDHLAIRPWIHKDVTTHLLSMSKNL